MANVDIFSDVVKADEHKDPVQVKEEDYGVLRDIQVHVDALGKYRQEMGRLVQLLGNMCEEANKVEAELTNKRQELSRKYNLGQIGTQWSLDFEKKEFVKTAPGTPVIP